jgi:hypothetical protein
MAVLQIRNFDDEAYALLNEMAKAEQRSISAQASMLLKKTLEDASSVWFKREKRRRALEATLKFPVSKGIENVDFVKIVHDERDARMKRIFDSLS